MRRDRNASLKWLGRARFRTVLLNTTISSSCCRANTPVSGASPVLMTTASLTHCQNCVCVVQNSLRSRQIMRAVRLRFFEAFFAFFRWAFRGSSVLRVQLRPSGFPTSSRSDGGLHQPRGEAPYAGAAVSDHQRREKESFCFGFKKWCLQTGIIGPG